MLCLRQNELPNIQFDFNNMIANKDIIQIKLTDPLLDAFDNYWKEKTTANFYFWQLN